MKLSYVIDPEKSTGMRAFCCKMFIKGIQFLFFFNNKKNKSLHCMHKQITACTSFGKIQNKFFMKMNIFLFASVEEKQSHLL